jgi:hypothetical protein
MSKESIAQKAEDGRVSDEPCRYIEVSAPDTDTDGHTIIPIARLMHLNKQIALIDRCLALLGPYSLATFLAVIDDSLKVPIVCESDLFQGRWPSRREVASVVAALENSASLMVTRLRENRAVEDDEVRTAIGDLPICVEPEVIKELSVDATSLNWRTAAGVLLLPKLDGSISPLAVPATEGLRPAKEPSVLKDNYFGTLVAHYSEIGLVLFADGTVGKVAAGQDFNSIRPGQKVFGSVLEKRGSLAFRVFAGPIQSSAEQPLFASAPQEAVSIEAGQVRKQKQTSGASSSRKKSQATAIAKYKSRDPHRTSARKDRVK